MGFRGRLIYRFAFALSAHVSCFATLIITINHTIIKIKGGYVSLMKLNKFIKYIYFLIFVSSIIFFNTKIALGAVGQSLSQMTQEIGTPTSVKLAYAVSPQHLASYQKIGVNAYLFKVNSFKITAVFNSSGICYKEFTYNNRSLPDPSLLIGSTLASEKPKVLMVIPLRFEKYQYGSGSNAVIYETSGEPGNLSAKAYSPSLAPSSN